MLLSEVPWFAMFIKICEYYFQFMDECDDKDYDAVSSKVTVIEKYSPLSLPIKQQILDNGFKRTKRWLRESWPGKENTNCLESWTIIRVLIRKPMSIEPSPNNRIR